MILVWWVAFECLVPYFGRSASAVQIQRSLGVVQKIKNNPKLMKHWDECHLDFLIHRSNINYLDELHHFKIIDTNAFDHLAFLKSRPRSGSNIYHATGGHTENIVLNGASAHFVTTNGLKILDPFYLHAIDPTNTSARMLNYLQNTKNNTNILTSVGSNNKLFKYEVNILASGHKEHRQLLFLMEPQPPVANPNQMVLNGQVYELPKPIHTQYKSAWTPDYIMHDMALASMNKTLKPATINEPNPFIRSTKHDQNKQWIQTTFESQLLDGTLVEITHVNYHRYNLLAPFNNHYSYFDLK